MGKQARAKKERKKKGNGKITDSIGAGDLRFVRIHVENLRKGVVEAEAALLQLGRDASFEVMQLAEELDDPKLAELGKKLVARKPAVETNLFALRQASVEAHLARALTTAAPFEDAAQVIQGPAVAVFDPAEVKEALVKGGRPRTDALAVGAGKLLWVGTPRSGAQLRVSTAEPAGPALELRLAVSSGVVFVGPPEASDGPRLGTVRIDPFHTSLDAYLESGSFYRLAPGHYAVHAAQDGGDLRLMVAKAPDERPLAIDLATLSQVP